MVRQQVAQGRVLAVRGAAVRQQVAQERVLAVRAWRWGAWRQEESDLLTAQCGATHDRGVFSARVALLAWEMAQVQGAAWASAVPPGQIGLLWAEQRAGPQVVSGEPVLADREQPGAWVWAVVLELVAQGEPARAVPPGQGDSVVVQAEWWVQGAALGRALEQQEALPPKPVPP
jgi:hypothetical protein